MEYIVFVIICGLLVALNLALCYFYNGLIEHNKTIIDGLNIQIDIFKASSYNREILDKFIDNNLYSFLCGDDLESTTAANVALSTNEIQYIYHRTNHLIKLVEKGIKNERREERTL